MNLSPSRQHHVEELPQQVRVSPVPEHRLESRIRKDVHVPAMYFSFFFHIVFVFYEPDYSVSMTKVTTSIRRHCKKKKFML